MVVYVGATRGWLEAGGPEATGALAKVESNLAMVVGDKVSTKEPNMFSCSREHWREGQDEPAECDENPGDKTDAGVAAFE